MSNESSIELKFFFESSTAKYPKEFIGVLMYLTDSTTITDLSKKIGVKDATLRQQVLRSSLNKDMIWNAFKDFDFDWERVLTACEKSNYCNEATPKPDSRRIIELIKSIKKIRYDSELAEMIRVHPATFANQLKVDKVSFERLTYVFYDLDFTLIMAEGLNEIDLKLQENWRHFYFKDRQEKHELFLLDSTFKLPEVDQHVDSDDINNDKPDENESKSDLQQVLKEGQQYLIEMRKNLIVGEDSGTNKVENIILAITDLIMKINSETSDKTAGNNE